MSAGEWINGKYYEVVKILNDTTKTILNEGTDDEKICQDIVLYVKDEDEEKWRKVAGSYDSVTGKTSLDVEVTGGKVEIVDSDENPIEPVTSIKLTPCATIGHGKKLITTAYTEESLAASTACKWVIIQAFEPSGASLINTDKVAVGGLGVDATAGTGTGIVLAPGDSVAFEISDLSHVYVDARVNGEGVRYTYGVD